MSYSDKCCGVCDQYQELYETGKIEVFKYTKSTSPVYKRFYDFNTNVCNKCISDQPLKDTKVGELELNIWYTEPKNITRGFTTFVDPDTGKHWRCHNSRLLKDEQHLCSRKLRFSNPDPYLYFISEKNNRFNAIKHEGLSKWVGIYSRDKRRLRRTLIKLGLKGDVKRLVP